MYEEKPSKLKIDFKSLIIKLVILLVVVFIVLWVASLFKGGKSEEVKSNIKENLELMKDASLEYFTASRLPSGINGTKKITLGEMIDTKLLIEFKDQNGNACDMKESFAEATKVNNNDYSVKVKLVCGDESDYVINTISLNKNDSDKNVVDDKKDNNVKEEKPVNNNINVNNNVNNSVNNNKTEVNKKPSTNNNYVNNNSTSSNNSTKKPSTNNKKPSVNTKPNTTIVKNSCSYGDLNYVSVNPVAYIINNNCAVSKNELRMAKYMNNATFVGSLEYNKITSEMFNLGRSKNVNLKVDSPRYTEVMNKSQKGYIGYQIYFTVREERTERVIYSYYLNRDGSRKVIIDNRGSLN